MDEDQVKERVEHNAKVVEESLEVLDNLKQKEGRIGADVVGLQRQGEALRQEWSRNSTDLRKDGDGLSEEVRNLNKKKQELASKPIVPEKVWKTGSILLLFAILSRLLKRLMLKK